MDSLPAKTCTKCGERKLLTEYSVASKEKDGRKDRCKICIAVDAKIYRAATKEQAARYHRERRINNPELYKQRTKRYKEANRGKLREADRIYRETNKEKEIERHRIYRENNPDLGRANVRRRRARKRNNGFEIYTDQQVLDQYGTACHLCTKEVDLEAPRRVGVTGWEDGLHIDHVIPISKGGPDTLDNVRPAHGQCNLKKNASIDFVVAIEDQVTESTNNE